jgi:UDP-glucose 4-epimerase
MNQVAEMGERRPNAILITGGAGYVGSQLIRDLALDEHFAGTVIRIFDNLQRGNYQALMDLPDAGHFQFIEGDILDPAVVRRALQGVDAVVHLAAIVSTPFSFDHPAWTEQVNHWGTVHLVEQCLEAGVTRFIFTSSASAYGPGGTFTEHDPCRPIGPYAQSKWRAEQAVLAAAGRGLRPSDLRLATVFGLAPLMRFDAVANRFAYLAGVGRPLTIYGSGQQNRPFVHVSDASGAIRFCLDHPEQTSGEIFNVVGENASILELADAIREAKPDVQVRYTEQDVLTHFTYGLRGDKFESLGWQPRYTIECALAEMAAHFRNLEPVSSAAPIGDSSFVAQ